MVLARLFAVPHRGTTHEKVVALTFDDGPNEPYTSRLVDLLGEKRTSATFFQVGRCIERHPGLAARMVEAGHVIGNHSYSHRLLHYLTEPSLRSEIGRTQAILRTEMGVSPGLFRAPWLCHQRPLLAEVRRQQLRAVAGTFAHDLEVAQLPAWRMARRAVERTRPGAVLIFHDGFDARGGFRGRTVEAVRLVIDQLVEGGYRFTTVDKLLGIPAYQASNPGYGQDGGSGRGAVGVGNPDPHVGALFERVDAHRAAVGPGDRSDQGQPEAGAM
jgi:peptidoglycan/xylan/chitin deacetylase (PgdA/CDA1 family)